MTVNKNDSLVKPVFVDSPVMNKSFQTRIGLLKWNMKQVILMKPGAISRFAAFQTVLFTWIQVKRGRNHFF